jgi:hypothetical protein
VASDNAFANLQEALLEVGAASPEQRDEIRPLLRDVTRLRSVAMNRMPAEQEGDYARSIQFNADLLAQASHAPRELREAILSDVAADLRLKVSAAASPGIGSTFNGRVPIRVTTRRGSADVNGYTITLNPVRYRGSEPFFRLAGLSPAEGVVPPGRYEIMATLAGTVRARDVVPIGLNAEDRMDIDLPVP